MTCTRNPNCKRQCRSFRDHVGNGPTIAASAMPSRSGVATKAANEAEYDKDFAAFERLDREGLSPQRVAGAAALEAQATEKVEVAHGRTYGGLAKNMAMIDAAEKE